MLLDHSFKKDSDGGQLRDFISRITVMGMAVRLVPTIGYESEV